MPPLSLVHAEKGVADTMSTALDLGTLSGTELIHRGTLDDTDNDWFKIKIDTPGTITIYTASPHNDSDLDPQGWLYNESGSQLDYNDDGGSHKNVKIVKKLNASGTYYIRLRVYQGFMVYWPAKIGDYDLHISFSGSGTLYYYDEDLDTFGTPNVYTTDQVNHPNWVTNNDDCNDKDASINPNALDNQCDGIDNDCDGDVDEDATMVTYYEDADGDGYGNTTSTTQACSPPTGWVATPGDCNDNNAAINPGAVDTCGDGIDQDCSGADRICGDASVCLDIADAPLTTQIKSAPPLVMFVLDDSGSMDFDILCNTDSGLFNFTGSGWGHYTYKSGYIRGDTNIGLTSYAYDVRKYWKTQWSGYNKVYYNPDVTYSPWPNHSNANPQSTRKHPVLNYGSTRNMDQTSYDSIDGVTLRYAHYYTVHNGTTYLVNLDQGTAKYYRVTDYGSQSDWKIKDLNTVNSSSVPSAIKVTSYASALQNMANWYQFCRNRELAAKTAVAKVIDGVSGMKIGLHAINEGKLCEVKPIQVDGADLTDTVLTKLYALESGGGTPLRRGLYQVGQYYDGNQGAGTGGIGSSPFASQADGGTCQQAFAIVMTDGYYNGDLNGLGNTDQDGTGEWDGVPYADTRSNTLADVAMHFYERDLRPDLANQVPTTETDGASHQHMVTYTLAFGVTGNLTPSSYDCPGNCPGGAGKPAWPNPQSSDKAKIDDMFHAAVNGRGKFLSAGNSEALVNALLLLMQDIQTKVMTGAGVSLNSQKLEQDTHLFQGYFDSTNWSGDLKAFDIIQDATGTITTTETWSAADQITAKGTSWWDTGRTILTTSDSGAVAFRRNNLSTSQKALLSAHQVNFLRGDTSNEKANGGTLRNRDGNPLGDIVNASPVYENSVVYVGANDGMLHAFDDATGDERFAYIPSFVYNNLPNLTDPSYSHNYFVDAPVYIRTINTHTTSPTTWLVGGLGKGGRGYYGIDITNPTDIEETDIPAIWEYPTFGTTDNDMGYTYSMPSIVKCNLPGNPYVIVFGNGYDSPGGKAVLYLRSLDGSWVKKIDTLKGSPLPAANACNGLSTPVPVDADSNGTVDIVYAGDLLGNLWKFDLSGTTTGSWGVAYGGHPLFTTQSNEGTTQPIVSRPAVMKHCDARRKGRIIVFGTGRYLAFDDTANTDTQSIYGIWDWADEWVDPSEKHFGTLEVANPVTAPRTLSSNNKVTLLKQWVTQEPGNLIKSTANDINWVDPATGQGTGQPSSSGALPHVGWYMDLPLTGERVVTKTQLLDGNALVVSIVPKNSPCTAGGGSAIYTLDACSGANPGEALFDTNDDNKVSDDDGINSGKRFIDDIYFAPAIINSKDDESDIAFFDENEQLKIKNEVIGLYYWKIIR